MIEFPRYSMTSNSQNGTLIGNVSTFSLALSHLLEIMKFGITKIRRYIMMKVFI
jgi:hypothetical protein